MSDYIELERRFVQRSDYSPEELLSAGYAGPRMSWQEILANRYAIIVAPANYGKTTELVQQAVQRRRNGEHVLFIKLREVSAAESLSSALDEGDSKAQTRGGPRMVSASRSLSTPSMKHPWVPSSRWHWVLSAWASGSAGRSPTFSG